MDDIERRLAEIFAERARDPLSAPVTPPPAHTLRRQVRGRQLAVTSVVVLVLAGLAVGSFAGVHALTNESPQPVVQPTHTARGGSITLGTRDYPECLNPITGCASNTGTWWTVLEHVMPRAMELDAKGNFVPSPLLAQAPTLENGDLTVSPFTIKYRLDPEADWADGTPITSADFEFTWRAIKNTTGSYTTARYDLITSIDTTDAKTAVITLASAYADWGDLFGGAYGGLLEEAAFPRYANDPAPDLAKEMQTDMPFSGGPWVLKSFAYPGKIVLVPNDRYFGMRPLLDQVTMVSLTDMVGAGHALAAGIIEAFPWPAEEGFLDQFLGDQNVRAIAGAGDGYEALWFNHDAPPLDDPKVREALMYAIDRQAVIDQVISQFDPQAQVLNCGFLAAPGQGPWCQTQPFVRFAYDTDKAKQILESDGYDCSQVPCVKGGQKLMVEYSTVSTNERRVAIQQLLQDRALPAGFDLQIANYDLATLFDRIGPHGQFTMAEYTSQAPPDSPSVTGALACESIPTNANDYVGGNWNHWCDRQATDLMHQSDAELDPAKRLQLMDQIYAIEAQDFLSLPLYVLPEMAAWRTDRIAGPIGEYAGSEYGLFFNMNEWSAVQR